MSWRIWRAVPIPIARDPQCLLVDYWAARSVNDHSTRLHSPQSVSVEQVPRLGSERAVEGHEIARREQRVEVNGLDEIRHVLWISLEAENTHAETVLAHASEGGADGA